MARATKTVSWLPLLRGTCTSSTAGDLAHGSMTDDAVGLVRRFLYRTRCFGASYELLLAPGYVRVSLVLPSPYVLSVGEMWDRVCTAGFDLTGMLVRTDDALRTTLCLDLAWRCGVVATERAATLTASSRLGLDEITADQVTALRTCLPRGAPTRSWLRYEQPADYLAVADRSHENACANDHAGHVRLRCKEG